MASEKGGLALLRSFAKLNEGFGDDPFILDSNLGGPIYCVMQTSFMRQLIHDAVADWLNDPVEMASSTPPRHGFVTDGDNSFFQRGVLLVTCVFSSVLGQWAPVLYTWIEGSDTAHHRAHFRCLHHDIAVAAGDQFHPKFLYAVRLQSVILDI